MTEQVLSNLRPALPKNNLALEVDCPSGLAMNSYPGPYGQVLTNLFVNAVAHAFPDGKGGTITIRLRASGADRVEILFADDGCGMDRDVLIKGFLKIFAPLAIGLALVMIHLVSIPVTNTSVNPARSTGPALFVGGWALGQLWLFWVAPLIGGALGGVIYRWLSDEPTGVVAGVKTA